MDQGPGYPHAYIPQPQQQFQFHPPAYPFGVPPAAPVQPAQGISGSGFFNPWELPPPAVPPPSDSDLQKRIEKLVEYAAKNGPQFEALMKEKQKDNLSYAFLFGAEGHDYYRYRLWLTINPHLGALNPVPPPPLVSPNLAPLNSSLSPLNPALASINPGLNPALGAVPVPQAGGVFRPPLPSATAFYGQQPQPFFDQFQHDAFGQYGLQHVPGPLPPEIAQELIGVLDGLTGTKESIKGAKTWFMQRVAFGGSLAEALRDRVLALEGDVDRQLHVIYLANDILFNSFQHRSNPSELDSEALFFRPVLGAMLAAVYHNRQDPEVNQERLRKILQFWGAKEVYDVDTINNLEGDMVAGPPPPLPPPPPPPPLPSTTEPSTSQQTGSGSGSTPFQYPGQWQVDQPRTSQPSSDHQQLPEQGQQPQSSFGGVLPTVPFFGAPGAQFTPQGSSQFVSGSVSSMYPNLPAPPFLAPLPTPVTQIATPALAQLPTLRASDQPPYPLFPPGLIPGMVRKMQIGSGVPYSPLSPLDIPTVIPPNTATQSYILERVAKFFKEIGEVDPLEGMKSDGADASNDGDDAVGREGGARIPPPHMQVDPETGTLPDGSVEHRPGVGSTGRLGLGAAADPNEVTQYDDVYTSYRKQRSTNYHTSLSARAAAAR